MAERRTRSTEQNGRASLSRYFDLFLHSGGIQGVADLEFRFPTTTKGFGKGLPSPGNGEEFHNRSFNRLSQSFEDSDRRIFESSFESAHVCAVNPGIYGQSFLGKFAANLQSAEISCH